MAQAGGGIQNKQSETSILCMQTSEDVGFTCKSSGQRVISYGVLNKYNTICQLITDLENMYAYLYTYV